MPRNMKTGLDYFSFDVDFFEDEKIQFVSCRFGLKGELVAIKLLCKIYRNGFYIKFDDDEQLLFANRAGEGITPALVKEIVLELVKRDFFNKIIFDRFKVLTSNGIQKRFFSAIERRKEQNFPKKYILPINVDINAINVDINRINVSKSTQSKVKESKVKESKEIIQKNPDEFFLGFIPEILTSFSNFETAWKEWVNYRKENRKGLTDIAAKRQLDFLAQQSEPVKIIERSIMNQWQGLFPLNEGQNGKNSKGNFARGNSTGSDITNPANAKYKYS